MKRVLDGPRRRRQVTYRRVGAEIREMHLPFLKYEVRAQTRRRRMSEEDRQVLLHEIVRIMMARVPHFTAGRFVGYVFPYLRHALERMEHARGRTSSESHAYLERRTAAIRARYQVEQQRDPTPLEVDDHQPQGRSLSLDQSALDHADQR